MDENGMNDDNFFSIERLVEFGLGVGIAQQMVGSMNQALHSTRMPGTSGGVGFPGLPASYFFILEGKQAGPFSPDQIPVLIASGQVTRSTYAWRPGLVQWEKVENLPDVLRIVALVPPPFKPEE